MRKKLTVADIFAGAGGLSHGFHAEGFEPIWAFESDKDARATYARNHGLDSDHIFDNVTTEKLWPAKDQAPDVLVGGPPCQDFTQLRYVRATQNQERNDLLWKYYLMMLTHYQPRVFVIENVANIFRYPEFDRLRETAESLDYALTWGVLNAADYGVPQNRERAFIIGVHQKKLPNRKPFLPAPHAKGKSGTEAILGLPKPVPAEFKGAGPWRADQLHVRRVPTVLSRLRYRYVFPEGNRFNLPNAITIHSWVGKQGTGDGYGRLYIDKPSPTIRCEPSKPEKGRYLHPWEDRPLTLREAATIQTFPPEFEFYGSPVAIARQIGNAVPPSLSRELAKAVKRLFDDEDSSSLEAFQHPCWNPTAPTGRQHVLKVLKRFGRTTPITIKELTNLTSARDWRSALRQLTDEGYPIEVNLEQGTYQLMADVPRKGQESPAAARRKKIALRLQNVPEARRLVQVLQPLPPVGHLVDWVKEIRSDARLFRSLVQVLGLSVTTQVPTASIPELTDPEFDTWCQEEATHCFLCDPPGTTADLTVERIRPNGPRRPENLWALCPACRRELAQTHLHPTGDRLVDRFQRDDFLTPYEADRLRWVERHAANPAHKDALIQALTQDLPQSDVAVSRNLEL